MADSVPEEAPRSDDGKWWWDGSTWHEVPPEEQRPPAAAAASSAAAGATAGTAGGTAGGDIPQEVVAMGFPASFSEWTDQHKHAYFVGDEPVADIQVETDQLEAVAMADATGEGGEALA